MAMGGTTWVGDVRKPLTRTGGGSGACGERERGVASRGLKDNDPAASPVHRLARAYSYIGPS